MIEEMYKHVWYFYKLLTLRIFYKLRISTEKIRTIYLCTIVTAYIQKETYHTIV